jgi:hypothetical protein
MNEFQKMFGILYVAYLDCENTVKVVSLISIGIVLGIFYFTFALVALPPDYTLLEIAKISITLWNMGVIFILLFQYTISLVLSVSVVKVAYQYDGGWTLIKKFNQQLLTDKQNRLSIKMQHEEMIRHEIRRIKEN